MTVHFFLAIYSVFQLMVNAEIKTRLTPQEKKRTELLRKQQESRTPAQKCSKKDFSKQLGPVREQGVGNCYAYQAADLLTYKLKLKPPEQVSATELSIRYSTFTKDLTRLTKNSYEGLQRIIRLKNQPPAIQAVQDSLYDAIDPIIKDESNYFKDFQETTQKNNSLHDIMDSGGWGHFAINLVNEDDKICVSDQLDRFGEDSDFIKELMAWMKLEVFAKCQNSADLQNFKDISSTNAEIYKLVVKKLCKNIKIKEPIKANLINLGQINEDGTKVIDLNKTKLILNKLLDLNQIAGINYNTDFMKKDKTNNEYVQHGSTIIGREFRDGQCWYMLRNSWGPGCDRYVTHIDSSDSKPDIDCKNGGEIWIREDQLLPNIRGIVYIE